MQPTIENHQITKVCIKCKRSKNFLDFYKMPGGSLGVDSKCKECAKLYAKQRHDTFKDDSEYKERERKRGREKYRRLYIGTSKANIERNKRFNNKFPEKRQAVNRSSKLIKPFTDAEKHHWSYNEEHFKDVIWLTKQQHKKGHRFIEYDPEFKMYRNSKTGELLNTKEKHEQFIRYCIEYEED